MEYGESENPLLLPMLMLKSGEIGRINCFQYATSKGGSELENIYVGTENGEIYTWNVHVGIIALFGMQGRYHRIQL